MPYNLIPFSSEWDLPITAKASPNASQYGESGFRQRETISINPNDKMISVKFSLGTRTKVNLMESFISENIGKGVRIPYTNISGGSSDDGNIYRFIEFEQIYNSPTCSTFTFECEQIRRLKV